MDGRTDELRLQISYDSRLRSTSNHAHICKHPEQSPCGAPVPDTNTCGMDFRNTPLNRVYRYLKAEFCVHNAKG